MRAHAVKRALLATAAAGALFASLFSPAASPQTTMKIGLATINDAQHEFAKRFAAQLEKQAPGKLKMEIYPSEQLGSMARVTEGLTLGTIEAQLGPPEFLVGQDPRYQIMGAPGVVIDMEHAFRLIKDPRFRNALLSFGDPKGIKGIGVIPYGANYYALRKAVRSVADFKGLKIRVFASPMHTLAMDKLGATGVPMNPSDALQALASGAIDGNRSGMALFVAFKYFDVVKSVTQVEGDAMIFSMLIVGKNWFDKLPGDVQKAMLEAAASVERDVTSFAIDIQRRSEATWKERGAEVIKITGADQAEFVKRMLTVGTEVVGKNPRIKDAYSLMIERAKATRR